MTWLSFLIAWVAISLSTIGLYVVFSHFAKKKDNAPTFSTVDCQEDIERLLDFYKNRMEDFF